MCAGLPGPPGCSQSAAECGDLGTRDANTDAARLCTQTAAESMRAPRFR
ncbi:unnamed protein product, partial [Amoebophrya sp. A120]|eukprot:GSA120T00016194001.1